MPERLTLERDATRLSCLDFGGTGSPVVLLHGLAGHAGEWSPTAAGLTGRHRVIAIDARGHGHSERLPADVSRAAHVADAVFVIEQLGLGEVALIGQSLGGHSGILIAAARPDLVSSLVVIEASPGSGSRSEITAHVSATTASLGAWPVPFPTREAAYEFWGGHTVRAEAWVSGLEQGTDGLRPRFEVSVMSRTLLEALSRSYWSEWESLPMEALLVRGSAGFIDRDHAEEMVRRSRRASLAEIAGAGHDVHLEQPDAWRDVLEEFLM